MPAQHDKRPRQKGRCEEVLSPVAAPNPMRPAIANAGLIGSFMWDTLWDITKNRIPKPTSAQEIGLIVFNPPSAPFFSFVIDTKISPRCRVTLGLSDYASLIRPTPAGALFHSSSFVKSAPASPLTLPSPTVGRG